MRVLKTVRRLWTALTALLVLGVMAYAHFLFTGSYAFLTMLFEYPGAVFFVLMTAAEVCLAFRARSLFDSAEPMYAVWTLIFLSACCRLAGAAFLQVLSAQIPWNPLVIFDALPAEKAETMRNIGLVVGGPVAMVLLAAGLMRVIVLQRRLGMLGRLSILDKSAIALICIFTAIEVSEIGWRLLVDHTRPGVAQAVLWLSDPLLAFQLIEAASLRRSVLNMGQGLVSRCWGMMALGVACTSAGDVIFWANWHGFIPTVIQPVGWFIWFFAVTAYASAPSYQIEAARVAHQGSYTGFPSRS